MPAAPTAATTGRTRRRTAVCRASTLAPGWAPSTVREIPIPIVIRSTDTVSIQAMPNAPPAVEPILTTTSTGRKVVATWAKSIPTASPDRKRNISVVPPSVVPAVVPAGPPAVGRAGGGSSRVHSSHETAAMNTTGGSAHEPKRLSASLRPPAASAASTASLVAL